jgi:hypothetical protein
VAISTRPWGVLDKAKKSFNPENAVLCEKDMVFIDFAVLSWALFDEEKEDETRNL